MLPAPAFSFTIPSIHDNTSLDCRIYHPPELPLDGLPQGRVWQKRGAVIAHAYAPLGGCQVDPVTLSAASELIRKSFVVGTFNFRGANGSKGKTSWTGKAELLDYISFAGFFIYYLHSLHTSSITPTYNLPSGHTLSPIKSSCIVSEDISNACDPETKLILAGYSYGAMIASRLPSTSNLIRRFAGAVKGTAEAEIRLRAQYMTSQWNKDTISNAQRGRSHHNNHGSNVSPYSFTVGGDESDLGRRRKSRETRHSMDRIRRSFEISRKRLSISRNDSKDTGQSAEEILAAINLHTPQTFYLLLSPISPPLSLFLTMFSKPSCTDSDDQAPSDCGPDGSKPRHPNPLTNHLTLAVYGDRDIFSSRRRLRAWGEHLAREADSKFRLCEVRGAGHFWTEEGADARMRTAIRDWAEEIVKG